MNSQCIRTQCQYDGYEHYLCICHPVYDENTIYLIRWKCLAHTHTHDGLMRSKQKHQYQDYSQLQTNLYGKQFTSHEIE